MLLRLWTIGHSTRPIEEFLAVLKFHGIEQLVDVRTVPKSRHNPQFNTDVLAKTLKKAKIAYRHMPDLGGLRKPTKESLNSGWRNASFRGYADYMQTDEFRRALEELMAYGTDKNTAIMCAEAVPWRCHRSLIADALIVRGWTVLDIMSADRATAHKLTAFATVSDGRLIYPDPSEHAAPRLFA
jgi:uncharacterized protein (DUF488 family)